MLSKPFHATNKPGTCLWCGHQLRKPQFWDGLGYDGNGHFCTLRCAAAFAIEMAGNGKRFEPKPVGPSAEKRKRDDRPRCPGCRRKLADVTDYLHGRKVFQCGYTGCRYHVAQAQFGRNGNVLTGNEPFERE